MALGDKLVSLADLKAAYDDLNGVLGILNTDVGNIQTTIEDKIDDAYVEDGYLYLTSDGEIVAGPLGPFSGGGGGGGGGDSGNNAVLTVTNTTGWLSRSISSGSECSLSVNWSSLEDDLSTGNGTLTLIIGGVVKKTQDIEQGDLTISVGDLLATGTNKVKVKISDVYDNVKTITFTISVIELSLRSSFDSSSTFNAGEAIDFMYIPTGAAEKTVHFFVDGTQVGTSVVTVSGRQQNYSLPAMTHGSHALRVYFTANINEEEVSSNELYYDLVVVGAGSNDTIVASSFHQSTATQFETLVIPYTVYTPDSLTSAVTLYANGNQVASLTVDRTEQIWSYRADTMGELTLTISSGNAVRIITLTVAESSIDVEPETNALSLYLTSYGRSNNEADPSVWEDTDHNVAATLTGFNWSSDGWVNDEDGATVLRVAGDARVVIPYKIFERDFRSTGKTIEVEFTTRNVMNYDTTILSCMSGGRGLSVTAQKASLTSEQSSVGMQYKENEHVRLSFVVEKGSENRLAYIYVNGIMSGVIQYPVDDDFSQVTPVNISIGSNDCSIDIYCIRVYDNDLTRHQVLNNWIADTQAIGLMLERYNRNSVYDEYGNIVIAQLPSDLPYMIIECEELPQYKGDKKTCSVSYIDPADATKGFTASGVQIDVQGTSSQYYARKNYKMKYKNGFDMTRGQTHVAKYSLRADSVPVNTFTMKADVASSEGANNVELVRLYNDTCPYKTPGQTSNSKVRQGIDGFPIVIFWSNGTSTTFLGKYNFNLDKSTAESFGFTGSDESWEILNNTSDRVIWKNADFTGDGWLNDFEARHPDTDPPYQDPEQLASFAEWVVSTDRNAATGNALATPYTDVDGVVHTVDNAAYRLAKFKTEASKRMEIDSALFYYLFTELFLMVDSRAKNAFPSFMGGEVTA